MPRVKTYQKTILSVAIAVVAIIYFLWWGRDNVEGSSLGGETDRASGIEYKSDERDSSESTKVIQRLEDADSKLSPHPKFHLFNDALQGNRALLSWAGLKPEQYDDFDLIIEETWRKLSADFEENAVLVPAHSSEGADDAQGATTRKEKDVTTYLIEASEERASARLSEFKAVLTARFGRGAAEKLTPYVSRKENMGGFGNYSVRIKFYKEIDSDMFSTDMAYIEITDPETRKTTRAYKGYTPNSSLYRIIGTAFDKVGERQPPK